MDKSIADDGKLLIRLEDILVIDFTIVAHPVVTMESELVNFEFGFNFKLNTSNDIIFVTMNAKFNLADDLKDFAKGASPVLIGNIQYMFKVKELKQFVKEEKQQINLGLMAHVISVAYSTSRGIIFERTRGYGVNGLPIPILNIENYVENMFIKPYETTTETSVFEQPS